MKKLNYKVYSYATECNIHTATDIVLHNLSTQADGTTTAIVEIQGHDRDV